MNKSIPWRLIIRIKVIALRHDKTVRSSGINLSVERQTDFLRERLNTNCLPKLIAHHDILQPVVSVGGAFETHLSIE
ncbi:hypothetical protein D3C73_1007330 [compost metagenome]